MKSLPGEVSHIVNRSNEKLEKQCFQKNYWRIKKYVTSEGSNTNMQTYVRIY